jgi:WD40 repeat protein
VCLNQVTKDHQLLGIAQDYFQFVAGFLEVIDVSATHIYHSALELSPLSSIVRQFYYSQCPHPSPKVVLGVPDAWDPSTATISNKHAYFLSSTWSPCGKFVAIASEDAVEIRDALALNLLSTLESPEVATKFRHGLAYSPDGHSLAGGSSTAIIIWDIQTGGVAKKIECRVTGDRSVLMWSLDGKTIALLLEVSKTLIVHTCEVTLGTVQSPGTVQSVRSTHLWAHKESFRIMATTGSVLKGWMIEIFDVGSTLTKIESFKPRPHVTLGVFSPATYRIVAYTSGEGNQDDKLYILEAQNSRVLLQETGQYWNHCFSHDGSVFAAVARDHLTIWRYTSRCYTQWRTFQQAPMSLQFSPTLSSILGYSSVHISVLHLDYSPTAPATESAIAAISQPLDAFAPYSAYIATTYCQKSTVTITNLHSQNPSTSQLIDTGLEISAMVLTGNILLVKSSNTVVAWLLTEEGIVDGIHDNRRANHNDCLWEMPLQVANFWTRLLLQGRNDDHDVLGFTVEGDTAAINHNDHAVRVYNTKTGEILPLDEAPTCDGYQFHHPRDECNQYHRDLYKHHQPPKCDQPIPQATLQGSWLKDLEGKHQLWLHPDWRSFQNVDWLHNVTTLRLRSRSLLVLVKF